MKNPARMSSEEIEKLPRRNVSIKQFLEICARFDDPIAKGVTAKGLAKLGNGAFLGVHSFDNRKTYRRLHLKTIWFKPYTLSYRTTKTKDGKARRGRELLISSFPLPRGKIGI